MKLSPCHHDNQDNLPAHLAFVHSSVVSVASPCYQLSSPSHCAPSAPSPLLAVVQLLPHPATSNHANSRTNTKDRDDGGGELHTATTHSNMG